MKSVDELMCPRFVCLFFWEDLPALSRIQNQNIAPEPWSMPRQNIMPQATRSFVGFNFRPIDSGNACVYWSRGYFTPYWADFLPVICYTI